VLDQHGEEADSSPQPDLAQVDSLVGRLRDAGLPVVLRVEGAAHDLPPGLAVTAYRIVQEALTNALKHTGSARTEVVIRYGERELTLEVTDDGGAARTVAAAGAGRGLLGMRERVAAYGGELEAGPRPGRGYAVRARLPLAV
jgi:signal transduction histidine kinase